MNHVAHIHSKENHLFAKGVSKKKKEKTLNLTWFAREEAYKVWDESISHANVNTTTIHINRSKFLLFSTSYSHKELLKSFQK